MRTKLFLVWGCLIVLIWVGTLWPVRATVASNFAAAAKDEFAETKRSLLSVQTERIKRMEQACWLVMNIPELRALIAEHNFELSSDNLASLQERLDALTRMMGVNFVCVLDSRGHFIAQNQQSPWKSIDDLRRFTSESATAQSLVHQVFDPARQSDGAGAGGIDGLWVHDGVLYQVVGVPLIFREAENGAKPEADGALIMATPITDQLARELGQGHGSEVTFLAGGFAVASSLPPQSRAQIAGAYRAGAAPFNTPYNLPFDATLDGVTYRSALEPLVDPSSQAPLGAMLIQSSLANAQAVQSKISRALALIMVTGLAAAALASFFLSGAVTRPVGELLAGVKRVADGDLHTQLQMRSRDELGQLAGAFNNMVIQLRSQRELQRLVEESQAASRAKSQFLANMSHEIRTPLNGVVGVAELLLTTPLNDKQRRYAGLIKSSGQVLTTLINDVLDFSKIEAGKMDIESIAFNPRLLVEEVIDLLSPRASAKGLPITSSLASEIPGALHGDPNRIRQILINLISNALKFTAAGHIDVSARLDSKLNNELLVRFSVNDTGIGIPAERMDRLFKSFSQVDASTTRKYGGTGLGLAISKQLAELMGGRIGVESVPGQGSTFWFTVKLIADANAETAGQHPAATINAGSNAAPSRPVSRQSARILLAEDHEVNQLVVTDMLANAGYECDVVSNGVAAVQAALSGKYALVLMDCQMPEMDGFEASRTIRTEESRRNSSAIHRAGAGAAPSSLHIPIIALTANAVSGDRQRCIEAGMDAYCTKPIEPARLIEAMTQLLESSACAVDPASQEAPASPEAPTGLPPIDLAVLNKRCAGKTDLVDRVLGKLSEQADQAIARLVECVAAGDAAQLAGISHGLKGTAGMAAAGNLQAVAARLESLGRAGDLRDSQQLVDQLRDEIGKCDRYIQQARKTGRAVVLEGSHASADRG